MSAEVWHGTLGGYTNHACRCDGCKAAQAAYQRKFRVRHAGTLAEDDARHGTVNGYENYTCRCRPCRDAHAAARRTYLKARAS